MTITSCVTFGLLPVLTDQFYLQNVFKRHPSSQCEHEIDTRTLSRFPSNVSAARPPGVRSRGAPFAERRERRGLENPPSQWESVKRRSEIFFWGREKKVSTNVNGKYVATGKLRKNSLCCFVLARELLLPYVVFCKLTALHRQMLNHLSARGCTNTLTFGSDFVT